MTVRLTAALLAAVMIAGCGYRGGLERPGPLWGEERARWEAEQKAKQDAEEKAPAQTPQKAP